MEELMADEAQKGEAIIRSLEEALKLAEEVNDGRSSYLIKRALDEAKSPQSTPARDPIHEQHEKFSIGIDCGPDQQRPSSFFPKILRGSGLLVTDFLPPEKLFGAWTWHLKPSSNKQAIFLVRRSLFEER